MERDGDVKFNLSNGRDWKTVCRQHATLFCAKLNIMTWADTKKLSRKNSADLCSPPQPRISFSLVTFIQLFRAESERLAAERLLEEAKSLIEVQQYLNNYLNRYVANKIPGCQDPRWQGADGGGRQAAAKGGGRRVLEGGAWQQACTAKGGDRGGGELEICNQQ